MKKLNHLVICSIIVTLLLNISPTNSCLVRGTSHACATTSDDQVSFSEISSITGSRIFDVQVVEDILYVLDADRGLTTYNISDKLNPTRLGRCTDSYIFSHAVVIENEYAYVADYEDGLEIVNISNPTDLPIIGQYVTRDTTGVQWPGSTDVHKSGHLAFLTSQDLGLEIIDCSDPFNPVKIGNYYEGTSITQVSAVANLVFISEVHNGFKILDVSDPPNPKVIYHSRETITPKSFVIVDNLAYVTYYDFGLRIFDVSELYNIVKVGEITIEGMAHGCAIKKTNDHIYAYVAAWEAGLKYFDVSDPVHIELIAQYSDGGQSYRVCISEEFVFVAEPDVGLEILRMNTSSKLEMSEPFSLGFLGLCAFFIFRMKKRRNQRKGPPR